MPSSDDDPRVVRSVAVTADDVVSALEYDRTGDRRAVLRLTPPFNGRMRARLHVEVDGEDTGAVHIDPADLVGDDRPDYPHPDETGEPSPSDDYSPERHYEDHVDAVREWREAIRDAVVNAVEIETAHGPHRVEVKRLG